MRSQLIEVIKLINQRVMGGANVLEIDDYITLTARCAQFGVTTDTKELGELYDSSAIA